MSEENSAGKVNYGVKVEDAVVKVNLDAEVDVIDVLKDRPGTRVRCVSRSAYPTI